jgi:flagellar biosynthetic protein FliR
MQLDAALQSFGLLHKQYGPALDSLLLLFCRMLAFTSTGPIFNRKNIPMIVKVSIAIYLTGTLFWVVSAHPQSALSQSEHGHYLIQLVMNLVVGALIGFIADMILQAAYSAGNLMNNQIGLSSAMILDPANGRQSMILEALFGYLVTLLFIYLGGVQWMVMALRRSLDLFPLYAAQPAITQTINLSYLITVSGNVLLVGVQLISPVIVITMAVDIMLGIVNRTAQQMPVFQLSFALKPAIGIAVMLLTLSTFFQALSNFLNDYSKIF